MSRIAKLAPDCKSNLQADEREIIAALRSLATRRERERLLISPEFPTGVAGRECRIPLTIPYRRIWEFLANIVFFKCRDRALATLVAGKAIQTLIKLHTTVDFNSSLLAGISDALAFLDARLTHDNGQIARINSRLSPEYRLEHAAAMTANMLATDDIDAEISSLDCEIARLREIPFGEMDAEQNWRENQLLIRRRRLAGEMMRLMLPLPRRPGLSPKHRRALAEAKARIKLLRAARSPLERLAARVAHSRADASGGGYDG
jgi:hypothetical protein